MPQTVELSLNEVLLKYADLIHEMKNMTAEELSRQIPLVEAGLRLLAAQVEVRGL